MMIDKKKKIHFVGIGGIGMSGIAIVLAEMGYKVSGSDLELSDLTRKIAKLGGTIFEGHAASNISKGVGLLIYSSAVSGNNPEFAEAKKRRIPIFHRSEILADLFNKKKGIAVTGTHGKTTTTSLIAVMLENCGLDPTIAVGGEIDLFGGNAKSGKGGYFVAEADESDGSFRNFKPFFSIITNIETEHMDYYKTIGDVRSAYGIFAGNLKKGGTVLYNKDDKNVSGILKGFKGGKESFGFHKDADIYPVDIEIRMCL
jgi:UDP-N-acetylmuramate--alanine ligase